MILYKMNLMKQFLIALSFFFSSALFAQQQVPTPQWRPLYHFTPEKYWTNDPNGLLYLNGVYQLYNQQNPYGINWGNMSWGHATSTDLIHWKHYDLAMPQGIVGTDTTMRFSGYAVWDKNNTSGLCKDSGCIVAIYTADQRPQHKESQFIAYSNDGGMNFTNYKGNPVLDLDKSDFRDPNVQWDEQLQKWLMVVSLPWENRVQFYNSPDLKNWNLLSEFGNAGLRGGIWECPFFIKLPVEGTDKTKWVLVNSFQDSSKNDYEEYYVGDFDGKTFTNDNPADKVLLVDHGDALYAAIPWNNLPEGQHTYIGWMVPPEKQQTWPWKGQMSIPRDLSLRETKDGIRLIQNPAKVIKENLSKFSSKMVHLDNVKIQGAKDALDGEKITGNSYWLEAEMEVPQNTMAGFKIAEKKDKKGNITAATVIGFDASKNEVYVDRSNSGTENINAKNLTQTMKVNSTNGKIKFEILFDKSSLEVFVNDGEQVLTTYVYPGMDSDLLSAFSFGGQTLIKSLKVWDMAK
ncbi:MAG TPA: glycoside hydrolase family 32 protein [Hanamia sp.]|nr:glycoside hydrolase family 32 protein [Hanamia sp.]